MVTLRYKSGTESKGNMLRAQAQSLEARLAVDQAERELGTARRELAQRLGRDDFADFTATGTFAAAAAPPRPSDLTDLLPLRPDVLVAEAQVRESRAAIAKSESSLWPSLSAVYSRSRGDGAEFPSARYSWAAGATLKYALFGGGPTSTWYGIKSSRRAFDAAKAGLDSVRQAALTDLQTAWAAYADAVDQVRVQGELLAAARQRNGEADIRYASGLLSYDNWEVIVSDRVSTESRAVAALRTAMNAEAAWYRALGRALGE
jgi:multidrug efflux system outer membrane protein